MTVYITLIRRKYLDKILLFADQVVLKLFVQRDAPSVRTGPGQWEDVELSPPLRYGLSSSCRKLERNRRARQRPSLLAGSII